MIMSLDRALSGNPFSVDNFRCSEAAAVLKGARLPLADHPWHRWPKARQLEFKLLFVSICHQINWDYLQSKVYELCESKDYPVSKELMNFSARDVRSWLGDCAKPERIRAEERGRILRATAESVAVLIESGAFDRMTTAPFSLEGPGGLYALLQGIHAFQIDPHQKKTNVLAHEIFLERIIQVKDPQNLRPAIDYHLIRLYLRTGRVYPTSREVMPYLLGEANNPRARLVQTLRGAVIEAAQQTAFYAGIDIATLNNVEWQLGRSVCTRTSPGCNHMPPDVLLPIVQRASDTCPYAKFCRSYTDSSYGFFNEPDFEKTFF